MRERFAVQELTSDNGLVTGIKGSEVNARPVTEQARIVIGADGMNSLVARYVHAPQYNNVPKRQATYFSYWSGVDIDGFELYPRDYCAVYGFTTNDGLTLVGANWALKRFSKLPAGIEESFFAVVDDAAPSLGERLRAGCREERWSGGAISGFFRKPFGPGWALVGDAGYKMDPCTAAGITNAFRDAELLAEAIDRAFASRRLEDPLAEYERRRNELATPIYEFTCQSALFEPPTAEVKRLLNALRDDPIETSHFFGLVAQTTPIREFLNPDNLARIIGVYD